MSITVPWKVFPLPVMAAGGVEGMGMAVGVVAFGLEELVLIGGEIGHGGFLHAILIGKLRHEYLIRAYIGQGFTLYA